MRWLMQTVAWRVGEQAMKMTKPSETATSGKANYNTRVSESASQMEETPLHAAAEEDDFVSQCRMQARELGERKLEQEQRLAALVESSFGQLEQIFNALLQSVQETTAAHHAQFEEASAMLEGNLDRHEQVETKLRAIMAILMGGSSQQ